ncbi:MAG: ATP-grasp domain-containing protein [Acidobacteria bacterium]|nr:ATP-grasp domain-containing protein [Acidobacteriota bacterium]
MENSNSQFEPIRYRARSKRQFQQANFMTPKILWFETGDLYTIRRGKEAGQSLGVQVDSIDVYDLTFAADGASIGAFVAGRNLVAEYDALIVRSFMPFVSEALLLARLFRAAGRVVVDESMTDEGYAMSKMHDYVVLAANGIDVPRTRQFCDTNESAAFAADLGYPCILKGIHGSEGRHVHKVDSERELRKKLYQYKSGEVTVQEFLDASEDYRVIVIGYEALPVYVSRRPRSGDFRTNFEFNEEVLPLPISEAPHLKDIAERAARTLRREFSGVDIRYRDKTPLVLEANRRPGFKGFEETTKFDVAGTFIEYVANKVKALCA